MNWGATELQIDYRFIIVDRVTRQEKGQITDITGGMIERKYLSNLKEGASLDWDNTYQLSQVGNDYLRIYLIASDGNETEQVALGTFMVSTSTQTISALGISGTADCYSVLQTLEDEQVPGSYKVAAGTNLIDKAVAILRERNLTVTPTLSTATLSNPLVFDNQSTMLDVLTGICDAAGYDSPGIDPYGNIILKPYESPTGRPPAIIYDDYSTVAFLEATHEFDWFSVPNRINVVCSTSDTVITGYAENHNPDSPFSIESRGRVISQNIDVQNITTSAQATTRAKRELSELTAVESFEVTHLYDDSRLGMQIGYRIGDFAVDGSITTQTINLDEGCTVTDHARVFVYVGD